MAERLKVDYLDMFQKHFNFTRERERKHYFCTNCDPPYHVPCLFWFYAVLGFVLRKLLQTRVHNFCKSFMFMWRVLQQKMKNYFYSKLL